MQQVRIFKTVETELSDLEKDVNAWIEESGAKIISITGNIAPQSGGAEATTGLSRSLHAPSDVVLIVLYETAAS
jgi:hypothetical protein